MNAVLKRDEPLVLPGRHNYRILLLRWAPSWNTRTFSRPLLKQHSASLLSTKGTVACGSRRNFARGHVSGFDNLHRLILPLSVFGLGPDKEKYDSE
jgi:hypothetical protein